MSNPYVWRLIVALILFGIGYYLAGSREDVNAILKFLDKIGVASGDTDEKRKCSGNWLVRALYIAGLAFVVSMGFLFYKQHRQAAATPYPGTQVMPYDTIKASQPATASPQPASPGAPAGNAR